jgi:rubrerythrin
MKFKRQKDEIELDWFKLSFTEYASGIEVFHAALFFRNDKNSQKRILDHALDEYRHSQYFYNLYKEEGKIEKVSSPHAIVNYGGLSNSPFPCSRDRLTIICSYLYIGEIRAIEFGKKVKENCKDTDVLSIFEIIDKDENNHATGLKRFLDKQNKFIVFLNIKLSLFKFYFSDRKSSSLITKLQLKAETFFTRLIFKYFPESIFEIKSSTNNFESVFNNKNRMS